MTSELRSYRALTVRPGNGNAQHLSQCGLCRSLQLPALNELHERLLWSSRRGKLSGRNQGESGFRKARTERATSLAGGAIPVSEVCRPPCGMRV